MKKPYHQPVLNTRFRAGAVGAVLRVLAAGASLCACFSRAAEWRDMSCGPISRQVYMDDKASTMADGLKQEIWISGLALTHVRQEKSESWPALKKSIIRTHAVNLFQMGGISVPGAALAADEDYLIDWTGCRLDYPFTPEAESALFADDEDSPVLKLWINRLSPAVAVHCPEPRITLFSGLDRLMPASTAYAAAAMTDSGIKQVRFEADGFGMVSGSSGAGGDALFAPLPAGIEWILVWFGEGGKVSSDQHRNWGAAYAQHETYAADCPMAIFFEHPPSGARLEPRGGLTIEFADEAGHLALMPLFGDCFPHPRATEAWKRSLPPEVAARCDWWRERLAQFPAAVDESYAFDRNSGAAVITEKFTFVRLWEGGRLTSPVPPALAAAARNGFQMEFSAPVADSGMWLASGPVTGIENAGEYTISIRTDPWLSVDNSPAALDLAKVPPRLTAEIHAQVRAILESGHMAPWHVNTGPLIYWNHSRWEWSNAGEILYFLAQALPLLDDPELRTKVRLYMRSEREAFPPESTVLLPLDKGAQREWFVPDPERISEKALKEIQDRYFHCVHNLVPVENLYYLACYYDAVPDAVPAARGEIGGKWDALRALADPYLAHQDWAAIRSFPWEKPKNVWHCTEGFAADFWSDRYHGRSDAYEANLFLAGTIGLHRLARMAGDSETLSLAAAFAAKQAAACVGARKMSLLWFAGREFPDALAENRVQPDAHSELRDPYLFGGRDARFLWGTIPETAAIMKHYLAVEMRRFFETYSRAVLPAWWLTRCDGGIECYQDCVMPETGYSLFLLDAWALDAPAVRLERFIDVPWVAKGDLYHLHKLTETARAYAAGR